ncbi:MAG: hypothetical protein M1350_08245 [Actinobacteria bacterium]|nr:hypothetical protein [Actinomycetota bacterium]
MPGNSDADSGHNAGGGALEHDGSTARHQPRLRAGTGLDLPDPTSTRSDATALLEMLCSIMRGKEVASTLDSSWVFLPARNGGGEAGKAVLDSSHDIRSNGAGTRAAASWLCLADGFAGTRGGLEEDVDGNDVHVFISGFYQVGKDGMERLVELPGWIRLPLAYPVAGGIPGGIRFLDMKTGMLGRLTLLPGSRFLATLRLASLAIPGTGVLVAWGDAVSGPEAEIDSGTISMDSKLRRSNLGETISYTMGSFYVPLEELHESIGSTPGTNRNEGAGTAYVQAVSYRRSNEGPASPPGSLAGLEVLRRRGIGSLLEDQRSAWQQRWNHADIEITGDPDMTRLLRFAIFHLISSVACSDEAPVGARGLSGPAYSGHVFWDSDVFVLPMLAATHPPSARAMLEYRLRRLDPARKAAIASGRSGLRFPWESAHDGRDVTPRSGMDEHGNIVPIRTGDMEEHITADVAWAAWQMASWTGKWRFLQGVGMPLLTETAMYWASRVQVDNHGKYHIYKVIGPDEYHEDVDDNAYTNIMAAWNLRHGAELLARSSRAGNRSSEGHGDGHGEPDTAGQIARHAQRLQYFPAKRSSTPDTPYLDAAGGLPESWLEIANSIVDGYNPSTGLYEQFTGYYDLEPISIADLGKPPLAADLVLGRERLARSQVIKQADVLMAYMLVPDELPAGTLETNLNFYLGKTAHGSSLSPGVHAGLLARAGRLDEAVEMLEVACAIDVDDLTGTAGGGIHLANFGAIWQAMVTGFAGIRVSRPDDTALHLDPHIPDSWEELKVRLLWHGNPLEIRCRPGEVEVMCDKPISAQIAGMPSTLILPPGKIL